MITTLTGKNDYAAQADLKKRVKEYKDTHGDLGLHNFDADESTFDQISEAASTLPFLTSLTMVVVRGLSGHKDMHDKVIQLLDTLPDTTDLIIYDPKLDKRGALYKVLQTKSEMTTHNPLAQPQLVQWVTDQFKQRETDVNRDVAYFLVDYVGENQWLLEGEVSKLSLAGQPVTKDLIRDMVEESPRDTIFQLLDQTLEGNTQPALDRYKRLKQAKLDAYYILSMIIWQLHVLATVKYGVERSSDEISKQAKLSPFVVRKTMQSARRVPVDQLKQMLQETAKVDLKIKSASVDADLLVEQLIVRLSTF